MKRILPVVFAGAALCFAFAQSRNAPPAVPKTAQQKTAQPKAAPKPAAKIIVPAPRASMTISVDPANPHYLFFRGRPTIFITSGEHYGAVLNASFDYMKYLDALQHDHMSLTRIFNGAYLETLDTTVYRGADQNTLAPRSGRYLAPWARSGVPGYAGGGMKFDLSHWDDNYFRRLKDFIREAGKRNIAVEVTLFSVIYGPGTNRWGSWNLNPLNPSNNINNLGEIGWDRFTTLDNTGLVTAQDALVRKTATELNGFDNIYYEVCNEPYFSGATARETRAWLNHMLSTIQTTEAKLPVRHLIAENVANGYAQIRDPNPAVSIFNFHYAYPPATVPLNWNLRLPIAFDETANGCATPDRRREAWAFILSGGAVYNNLDPSFATDDSTGTGQVSQEGRTYNCAGVRYELHNLADFVAGLDLTRVEPNRDAVQEWPQHSSKIYMLDDPGHVYAMYFEGGKDTRTTTFLLDAPAGRYEAAWLNPRTGDSDRGAPLEHKGGALKIETPAFSEDLAVRISRLPDVPVSKTAPPAATSPSSKSPPAVAPQPAKRPAPPPAKSNGER